MKMQMMMIGVIVGISISIVVVVVVVLLLSLYDNDRSVTSVQGQTNKPTHRYMFFFLFFLKNSVRTTVSF